MSWFLRGMDQMIHFCATMKNIPSQFILMSSSVALFWWTWLLSLFASENDSTGSFNWLLFVCSYCKGSVHERQTFASNSKVLIEKTPFCPPWLSRHVYRSGWPILSLKYKKPGQLQSLVGWILAEINTVDTKITPRHLLTRCSAS